VLVKGSTAIWHLLHTVVDVLITSTIGAAHGSRILKQLPGAGGMTVRAEAEVEAAMAVEVTTVEVEATIVEVAEVAGTILEVEATTVEVAAVVAPEVVAPASMDILRDTPLPGIVVQAGTIPVEMVVEEEGTHEEGTLKDRTQVEVDTHQARARAMVLEVGATGGPVIQVIMDRIRGTQAEEGAVPVPGIVVISHQVKTLWQAIARATSLRNIAVVAHASDFLPLDFSHCLFS
jgi:hypothetical protein